MNFLESVVALLFLRGLESFAARVLFWHLVSTGSLVSRGDLTPLVYLGPIGDFVPLASRGSSGDIDSLANTGPAIYLAPLIDTMSAKEFTFRYYYGRPI
jgi:hypothetical protein